MQISLRHYTYKKEEEDKIRYNIYKIFKKLFEAYKQQRKLAEYKREILLNKYNRSIRSNYFTIYPKKYHNIRVEFLYKKYQKYIHKMEDLLYVEYMENVYRKFYHQTRFERDSYNSPEKERELFSEYDKTNLMALSLLFENPMSHTFLIPKMKEIKRMYKDFRVTNKYFVNMKRLEKTFIIPNSLRMSDTRIAHIVRKSFIYKIKKPVNTSLTFNRDSIKGPPNIFKECLRIQHISNYIKKKLNNKEHIKNKYKIYITKHIRKFYFDTKWNFIFINKIYRDIPGLLKKSLRYTYNAMHKINTINIDIVNNKQSRYTTKDELLHRTLYINSMVKNHEILSNKIYLISSKEIIQAKLLKQLYTIHKILYIRIMSLITRENIRNLIKNRIINYYMPYVNIMSKQYLRSGYYADISDLIQEGTIGVIEAAERYQLGRGVRFLTYAYWWMHRYMIKIAIKKKRIFKLNKKLNTQKKLFVRINALYENIKRKSIEDNKKRVLNTTLSHNETNKYQTVKHVQLKNILIHKDFVIYALHKGIYPYKEHTTEQIATILEIPEHMVQTSLKRANKSIANI